MEVENVQIVKYENWKGDIEVNPTHRMVKHWVFTEETEEEAMLANAMALVAQKSNISLNDLQHLFPAVLRMLKNDSIWSK